MLCSMLLNAFAYPLCSILCQHNHCMPTSLGKTVLDLSRSLTLRAYCIHVFGTREGGQYVLEGVHLFQYCTEIISSRGVQIQGPGETILGGLILSYIKSPKGTVAVMA